MPSHQCAIAFLFAAVVVVRSAQQTCRDEGTCEDLSVSDLARGSAMMQVNRKVAAAVSPEPAASAVRVLVSSVASPVAKVGDLEVVKELAEDVATAGAALQATHLEESRSCVPMALQEIHFQSIRKNAARLAAGHLPSQHKRKAPAAHVAQAKQLMSKEDPDSAPEDEGTTEAPALPPSLEGTTESPAGPPSLEGTTEAPAGPPSLEGTTEAPATGLATEAPANGEPSADAAGFLETTSLCCPVKMEEFFTRLLHSMDLKVCSKPHVQGLMHWFTCVPDMDFQYMLGVINEGNPCKYWSPNAQTCPALSAQCEGEWCR